MKLFFKECRNIAGSVVFLLLIVVLVFNYATQFSGAVGHMERDYNNGTEGIDGFNSLLVEPKPGRENYGYVQGEVPEQVIPAAAESLYWEYENNSYTTYPIGFVKIVKLNQDEQEEIAGMLQTITGMSVEGLREILKSGTTGQAVITDENGNVIEELPQLHLETAIGYSEFQELMQRADDMLGGGSKYALENLYRFGSRPVTYEEAMTNYKEVMENDKITGAAARLYCDYTGIMLALFSVFVPVAFMLRDRRAKMQELIYVRKISSLKFIAVRFASITAMIMLPVFLMSLIPLVQLELFAAKNGLETDILAFVKYIAVWLLPTVLFTVSAGMFFTVLTDTPIGIPIVLIYAFIGVFANSTSINGGNYGFELAIRHNSLEGYGRMMENIGALILNRMVYAGTALLLLIASVVIYELKRRGRIDAAGKLEKIWRNISKTNTKAA